MVTRRRFHLKTRRRRKRMSKQQRVNKLRMSKPKVRKTSKRCSKLKETMKSTTNFHRETQSEQEAQVTSPSCSPSWLENMLAPESRV